MEKFSLRVQVLIALISLLQACSGTGQRVGEGTPVVDQSVVDHLTEEQIIGTEAGGSPPIVNETTPAIAALYALSNAHIDAGRLDESVRVLERALRIEPSNPHTWHRMARVKFIQVDYEQAAVTASRSNTFVGSDDALRQSNLVLMLRSYEALGDSARADRIRSQIGDINARIN